MAACHPPVISRRARQRQHRAMSSVCLNSLSLSPPICWCHCCWVRVGNAHSRYSVPRKTFFGANSALANPRPLPPSLPLSLSFLASSSRRMRRGTRSPVRLAQREMSLSSVCVCVHSIILTRSFTLSPPLRTAVSTFIRNEDSYSRPTKSLILPTIITINILFSPTEWYYRPTKSLILPTIIKIIILLSPSESY